MAVVRNLMIRIGADYSAAKQGMDGASRELSKFKRDTVQATNVISGRRGFGGVAAGVRDLTTNLTSSFSRMRGVKGISGFTSELKALTPGLRGASAGMSELGVEALGASRALGTAGLAIGIVVGLLAAAAAGLYKASQPAVKFEADLGRLNMQLQGSSRAFMDWARSQGLAKSTAAEMGATYAVLLSSFIKDNKELATQTQNFVQATRVVASATGRSIEDVTERMRSGLLGNTEAIEDLGVFVNVSMIESTKAFQKFANGKHWEQLDYRTQQQIRLQAILEQAYDRYGNSLQNNVMTKQTQLMEQLKDIKLNLSQAFLPIWDAVLPALTKLAGAIADVTEGIARFSYWLRGWNYDEMTKGTDKQTDAVQKQTDSYQNLGNAAKKAHGELAAFDQLNLLGDSSGGSGTGTGTPGGPGGSGGNGGGGGGSGSGGSLNIPPLPKLQLKFDPPSPPDAGIGAVATAVVSTVNNLIAQVKQKLSQMWSDLSLQTQAAAIDQQKQWNQWLNGVAGVAVPGFVVSVETDWANMWASLRAQTATGSQAVYSQVSGFLADTKAGFIATDATISADWSLMLQTMLNDLSMQRIALTAQWEQWKTEIASIQNPLTSAQTAWKGALSYFQNQLNAYQPYLSWGWHLIAQDIRNLESPLADIKKEWSDTLESMYTAASAKLGSIVSLIGNVTSAWSSMVNALSGSKSSLPSTSPVSTSPVVSTPSQVPASTPSEGVDLSLSGLLNAAKNDFSADSLAKVWGIVKDEADKPENKAAFDILSIFAGGSLLGTGSKALSGAKDLLQTLKGFGISVPAFAGGALAYGPTLAMVGDNIGASTDPEVIAPVSDLADYMSSDDGDDSGVIEALGRVERAVKDLRYLQAVISRSSLMDAVRDFVDSDTQRGRTTFQSL